MKYNNGRTAISQTIYQICQDELICSYNQILELELKSRNYDWPEHIRTEISRAKIYIAGSLNKISRELQSI